MYNDRCRTYNRLYKIEMSKPLTKAEQMFVGVNVLLRRAVGTDDCSLFEPR